MVVERIRHIVLARAVLPDAPKRFVKQFMLSIKVGLRPVPRGRIASSDWRDHYYQSST
jgi:hypothetical protein